MHPLGTKKRGRSSSFFYHLPSGAVGIYPWIVYFDKVFSPKTWTFGFSSGTLHYLVHIYYENRVISRALALRVSYETWVTLLFLRFSNVLLKTKFDFHCYLIDLSGTFYHLFESIGSHACMMKNCPHAIWESFCWEDINIRNAKQWKWITRLTNKSENTVMVSCLFPHRSSNILLCSHAYSSSVGSFIVFSFLSVFRQFHVEYPYLRLF